MESLSEAETGSVAHVCRSGRITETVVAAVAEAKGVDPLELEPLYDAVDPDGLNRLFRPVVGSVPTDIRIGFSYADCRVVVHGDGEVVATPEAEWEGEDGRTALAARRE